MGGFKFIKDYYFIGKVIKAGTIAKIIDGDVVDNEGNWLLNLDSPIAKEYGYQIISVIK